MSDGDNENGQGGGGQGGAPGGRGPLSLKPRGGGQMPVGTVRQSFSHGRSKTVVVETKRRRGPGEDRPPMDRPRPAPTAAPAAAAPPRPAAPAPTRGSNLNLSQSELAARQRALDVARQSDERRSAEESTQRRSDVEARIETPSPEAPQAATMPAAAPSAPAISAPAAPVPPLAATPQSAPPTAAAAAAAAPAQAAAPQPAAPRAAEPPAAPRAWERLGPARRVESPNERPAAPAREDVGARPQAGFDRPREGQARNDGYGARPQSAGYGDRVPRPKAAPDMATGRARKAALATAKAAEIMAAAARGLRAALASAAIGHAHRAPATARAAGTMLIAPRVLQAVVGLAPTVARVRKAAASIRAATGVRDRPARAAAQATALCAIPPSRRVLQVRVDRAVLAQRAGGCAATAPRRLRPRSLRPPARPPRMRGLAAPLARMRTIAAVAARRRTRHSRAPRAPPCAGKAG